MSGIHQPNQLPEATDQQLDHAADALRAAPAEAHRNIPSRKEVERDMRIGELAQRVGVNPKTIRFYEARGLLPEPERTTAGYRRYTPGDGERITFIKTAQRLGMSLDEVGETLAFRDRGEPPCDYVRRVLAAQMATIDQRIGELAELREQLARLQAESEQLPEAASEGCYCHVIEHAAIAAPTAARRARIRPRPLDGAASWQRTRPSRSARDPARRQD